MIDSDQYKYVSENQTVCIFIRLFISGEKEYEWQNQQFRQDIK